MSDREPRVYTFLMFAGVAEEAMTFYTTAFEDAEITQIIRYGPNEAGKEGSVLMATFTLKGQVFRCIDSAVEHPFTFTPAISLWVECDTEAEIDGAFQKLSEGGEVMVPLAPNPFSAKYGWVQDRFGVSWQLNLAR